MADAPPKVQALKLPGRLLHPSTEDLAPVSITFWKIVMDRIRAARDSSSSYAALGWWCWGAGTSSAFSALAFWGSADFGSKSINWYSVIILFVFVLFAALGCVCGGVSLRYSKQHKKDKAAILEYVLEDMQGFLDKHPAAIAPAGD